MEKSAPRFKATVVSLTVCALCVGVVMFVTGCPLPPTGGCTTDADCVEGQVCNTQTAACEDAPTGCTSGADCDANEFCDAQRGECVTNENLYGTTSLDTDFDRVHALHTTCTACHHDTPVSAGFQSCRMCHADDPNEDNSFKDVAHDANESGDGCRMCHDSEFGTNCAFCHTALGG